MKTLLLLLTVFLFSCQSQKESANIPAKLDEYLSGQAKYFRFNGNVLVAANGKIILQNSYGYADYDSERMLNDSSVFELASVSKQFTATGILLLKDKGKLKLTDSLVKSAVAFSWSSGENSSAIPNSEEISRGTGIDLQEIPSALHSLSALITSLVDLKRASNLICKCS